MSELCRDLVMYSLLSFVWIPVIWILETLKGQVQLLRLCAINSLGEVNHQPHVCIFSKKKTNFLDPGGMVQWQKKKEIYLTVTKLDVI